MKTKLFLISLLSVILYGKGFSQCTPSAGTDTSVCGQTYNLQGTLSQPGSTALWTSDYTGTLFTDDTQPVTSVWIPNYT